MVLVLFLAYYVVQLLAFSALPNLAYFIVPLLAYFVEYYLAADRGQPDPQDLFLPITHNGYPPFP
jgi:hypothetical protein